MVLSLITFLQEAPPDFRPYVFGAYTVAFILLFAFLAIIWRKQAALDSQIAELKKKR